MREVCALLQVCQLANYLKSVGVKRGSDVTIYMPMIPELPAAMVRRSRCSSLPTLLPASWIHAADVSLAVSMLCMHPGFMWPQADMGV